MSSALRNIQRAGSVLKRYQYYWWICFIYITGVHKQFKQANTNAAPIPYIDRGIWCKFVAWPVFVFVPYLLMRKARFHHYLRIIWAPLILRKRLKVAKYPMDNRSICVNCKRSTFDNRHKWQFNLLRQYYDVCTWRQKLLSTDLVRFFIKAHYLSHNDVFYYGLFKCK